MKLEDGLYFSPNYAFKEIKWNDKEKLITAFEDRIRGFYLEPIKLLLGKENAFGAGVICITTIDCLAKFEYKSKERDNRIEQWFRENTKFNSKDYSKIFYKNFRCGLVHEGRIKEGSYFWIDENITIVKEEGIMAINPKYLYDEIINYLKKYIDKLQKNEEKEFENFKFILDEDFKEEIKCTSE